MTLTRDDAKWVWGRVVSIVMTMAGLSQDALTAMGIPVAWQPKILIAGSIIGIVSGTYGNSPLRGDPMKRYLKGQNL